MEQVKPYWEREDYEDAVQTDPTRRLIEALTPPDEDPPARWIESERSSGHSIEYPKTLSGAVLEIRARGLLVDEDVLKGMVADKIVAEMHDATGAFTWDAWDREDIDAAIDELVSRDALGRWASFCWVANINFGQAVRAHRAAQLEYGLPAQTGFDVPGLTTVIRPTDDGRRSVVQFYPGTADVQVTVPAG